MCVPLGQRGKYQKRAPRQMKRGGEQVCQRICCLKPSKTSALFKFYAGIGYDKDRGSASRMGGTEACMARGAFGMRSLPLELTLII